MGDRPCGQACPAERSCRPTPVSLRAGERCRRAWILCGSPYSSLIWRFYRDLKPYCRNPTPAQKAALRIRFDRICKRQTGFVTLDRLLARLYANKAALLTVLDRPEIPPHTNNSENDIRSQVASGSR